MNFWPGFSKPPAPVAAPAPLPTREDPAVKEAQRAERNAAARRRGRRATVIAGRDQEALGVANVARPEARGAQVLG